MTAARPYRMTPLTPEQALTELRKFAGIQFDPLVVDAFVRTSWVEGIIETTTKPPELRAIPTIGQVADRMTDRMTKPTTVAEAAHPPEGQADLISGPGGAFQE